MVSQLRLTFFLSGSEIDIEKAALQQPYFIGGWNMGFEPTTFGTTIRRSNQLS
jgi:hypothetical protein